MLPTDFAGRAGALERFQREAQVMANLEHPNIIRVDEFGETGGRYWLRMELGTGYPVLGIGGSGVTQRAVTLADLAEACGGKIAQERLLGILKQVVAGLGYAHERGAIHRDLKPSNILLCTLPNPASPVPNAQCPMPPLVKISDFGLVRLVGEEWVRSQAQVSVQRSMSLGAAATLGDGGEGTSTRSLLGTYEYMSPEQKRGEEADERSDIYALGLMTYRLLTGREVSPKPPSRINAELVVAWDDLVIGAMEGDRAERLAGCGAFAMQLAGVERELEARVREKAAREAAAQEEALRRERAVLVEAKGPVAGEGMAVDLGGGVKLEFVWVKALNGWVGKYEVSNGEYRRFKGDHDSGDFQGQSLNGDRQPVVNVSYDDAVAFAEWVNGRGGMAAGYRVRLPDGDEWMTFAQCGDRRKYPWGNEWPPKYGNYADTAAKRAFAWSLAIDGYDDGAAATCAVEGSGKNDWGLYGVGGNVWEWTSEQRGSARVLRGASWLNFVQVTLRCAFRYELDPSNRYSYFGFRLVVLR